MINKLLDMLGAAISTVVAGLTVMGGFLLILILWMLPLIIGTIVVVSVVKWLW